MWLRNELSKLDPHRRDLRQFGFVLGGALVALSGIAWYRDSAALPYLLGAGGLIALVGAVAPQALRPVYFVWMAIGLTLGTIVTAIILTVVFFGAITPIGLVMKVLRKDPMRRRLDPDASTYWIQKEHGDHDKSRYFKYF